MKYVKFGTQIPKNGPSGLNNALGGKGMKANPGRNKKPIIPSAESKAANLPKKSNSVMGGKSTAKSVAGAQVFLTKGQQGKFGDKGDTVKRKPITTAPDKGRSPMKKAFQYAVSSASMLPLKESLKF